MKQSKNVNISAEDTVQIIIRGVPKTIHNEFKAACAIKNTTIRARIIELMQTDVKAHRK
jgi:hypothetical protein